MRGRATLVLAWGVCAACVGFITPWEVALGTCSTRFLNAIRPVLLYGAY